MTTDQEDCFYDFIEEAEGPFSLQTLLDHIRERHPGGTRRLDEEVLKLIHSRRLAFPGEDGQWTNRRGAFEGKSLLVKPSRVELENGVFFPGHRALPLMNPLRLPHELSFTRAGRPLPWTTIEAEPDELYCYYDLFGEEYAPQYIARDNTENEKAYNADPYEDPPEVSVHCLDMRAMYREEGFLPGDYLKIRCMQWKAGLFELERVPAASQEGDAQARSLWEKALRTGFSRAFDYLGPGNSTEEQIAWAFWYAGERVFDLPAYSLEEFLWERDNGIDTVAFGMETRFWHTGKEIPLDGPWDQQRHDGSQSEIEKRLDEAGIPASEFVLDAYVMDAFWRGKSEPVQIMERIIPPGLVMEETTRFWIFRFILEAIEDLGPSYNPFADKDKGPLRSRACDLYSAILALANSLGPLPSRGKDSVEGNLDWIPKHLFVTLSQLRLHCGNILEDIDWENSLENHNHDAVENSITNLEDSFADLREELEDARRSWRKNKLSIVKPAKALSAEAQREEKIETDAGVLAAWYSIQISLIGTKVWRRLHVPDSLTLAQVHDLIQLAMGWSSERLHGFVADGSVYSREGDGIDERHISIADLVAAGKRELEYDYDYSAEWEFKVRILHEIPSPVEKHIHCAAGECAAPPENIGGALRWRRLIQSSNRTDSPEGQEAERLLGKGFDPEAFDREELNTRLERWGTGKGET